MDFDRIAATQEFEGNTIDAIFPKKRQTRKRKISNPAEIGIILKPVLPSQDSPEELNKTATQRTDSQEPFTFTNDNIFRHRQTTSALFNKYYPPQVLKFTDEELQEINELYADLQEKQVAGEQGRLTQANVTELDKSCLIERFLKETICPPPTREEGSQESGPFTLDSGSPLDADQMRI